MRRVLVESPFAGRGMSPGDDAVENHRYALALCRHLALRGDAPFAPHLFVTQFLDDEVDTERSRGIDIGLQWGVAAALTVVGVDRGISAGMRHGIERARLDGRAIEWLSLGLQQWYLPALFAKDEWKTLWREGDACTGPVGP